MQIIVETTAPEALARDCQEVILQALNRYFEAQKLGGLRTLVIFLPESPLAIRLDPDTVVHYNGLEPDLGLDMDVWGRAFEES